MSFLHASLHNPVSCPSTLIRPVSPTLRLVPTDFEFRLEPAKCREKQFCFGTLFRPQTDCNGRPHPFHVQAVILKADSHIAWRAHAVPLPCRALIHTCHAAPLPCSESAVSFVKVRVVAGNIRTASPAVLQIVFFCSVLLPFFIVVGMDHCEGEWYASDNNLRGTPRGSRKKPKAGR
jgi:hypothetical protein